MLLVGRIGGHGTQPCPDSLRNQGWSVLANLEPMDRGISRLKPICLPANKDPCAPFDLSDRCIEGAFTL